MKPTKAKELLKDLAQELNQDEDLVRDVVNFYWRDLRKQVSSLKHCRVHVTNLGDFVVKHWKLEQKIQDLERFEEVNRQKGLQQINARFRNAEVLYDLRNLQALINAEKQRKQFVKLHQSVSHEAKGQPDTGMEG